MKPRPPRKRNRSASPPTPAPKYVIPEKAATLTVTMTCTCGAVVEHEIPWAFGAFEETGSRLCSIPCSKCRGNRYQSVRHYHPPIDEDILTVWSRHSDVCFSSQDEDLLLASPEYLPWMEKLIDDPRTHPWKRGDLIGAIITLIYNCLPNPNRSYTEAQLKASTEVVQQAIAILKPRLATGKMHDNGHWGYIAKAVYPLLGLSQDGLLPANPQESKAQEPVTEELVPEKVGQPTSEHSRHPYPIGIRFWIRGYWKWIDMFRQGKK